MAVTSWKSFDRVLLMQSSVKGGSNVAQAKQAWQAACAFFILGLVLAVWSLIVPMALITLCAWVTSIGCLVCGIVLLLHGAIGRGIAGIIFALLTVPMVLVWIPL